jgi:hypothetical protein
MRSSAFSLNLLPGNRPGLEIPEVDPSELTSTRQKALIKFGPYLSAEHFSLLCYLMRNLAPAITGENTKLQQEMRDDPEGVVSRSKHF